MKNFYEGMPHCNYRISAKAIIRNKQGKFVLCLKKMQVHGKTEIKWDIPGGGIDHGEDIVTTLRREIHEEMGLKAIKINPAPKYFFLGESACGGKPLALICYEVQVDSLDYTVSDECLEMKFFSLEEALATETYSMVEEALKETKEKFGKF